MWLKRMQELTEKPTKLVVGLMSGTSADGIDAALCALTRGASGELSIELKAYSTSAYSNALQDKIKRPQTFTVQDVAEVDVAIGQEFASATKSLLDSAGLPSSSIDLIGSHGQTVYHHSAMPGAAKTSLQLGCADTIASTVGVPVVYDFRRKDLVLGGEGAPLTPYTDFMMYHKKGARRAILNLGGIANITILGDSLSDVKGFDTGPANAPLDRLAALYSGGKETFDKDGAFARSGTVNKKLLDTLVQQDSFLAKPPPKSTGFESYGDSFVRFVVGLHGGIDQHLIATVTEFVAVTIAQSIKRYVPGALDEIILAGGGARNSVLVDAITKLCAPAKIKLSDEVGINADAREAVAFAILAHDAVMGLPTSLPGVTGASQAVTLGKIAIP